MKVQIVEDFSKWNGFSTERFLKGQEVNLSEPYAYYLIKIGVAKPI